VIISVKFYRVDMMEIKFTEKELREIGINIDNGRYVLSVAGQDMSVNKFAELMGAKASTVYEGLRKFSSDSVLFADWLADFCLKKKNGLKNNTQLYRRGNAVMWVSKVAKIVGISTNSARQRLALWVDGDISTDELLLPVKKFIELNKKNYPVEKKDDERVIVFKKFVVGTWERDNLANCGDGGTGRCVSGRGCCLPAVSA